VQIQLQIAVIYLSVVLRRKAGIIGPLYEYVIKQMTNIDVFLKESHSHLRQRVYKWAA